MKKPITVVLKGKNEKTQDLNKSKSAGTKINMTKSVTVKSTTVAYNTDKKPYRPASVKPETIVRKTTIPEQTPIVSAMNTSEKNLSNEIENKGNTAMESVAQDINSEDLKKKKNNESIKGDFTEMEMPESEKEYNSENEKNDDTPQPEKIQCQTDSSGKDNENVNAEEKKKTVEKEVVKEEEKIVDKESMEEEKSASLKTDKQTGVNAGNAGTLHNNINTTSHPKKNKKRKASTPKSSSNETNVQDQNIIIVLNKTIIWAASKYIDDMIEKMGEDTWDCDLYLKLIKEKLGNSGKKFYRKPNLKNRHIPDHDADVTDEIKAYMLSCVRQGIASGMPETEALLDAQKIFDIKLPEKSQKNEDSLLYPNLQDKEALNTIFGLLYGGLFFLGAGFGLIIALLNNFDLPKLLISIIAGIGIGIGLGLIVNVIIVIIDRYYSAIKITDFKKTEKN